MPLIHYYTKPFRWEILDNDELTGFIHDTGEADTLPAARAAAEEALRTLHQHGVLARLYSVAPDDPNSLFEVGDTRGPTWGRPKLAASEAAELSLRLQRLAHAMVEESKMWRQAQDQGAVERAYLARSKFYSLLEALREVSPEPSEGDVRHPRKDDP